MAKTKIYPLFTVMMNSETVCYGERCAWAINEEDSAEDAIRLSPFAVSG